MSRGAERAVAVVTVTHNSGHVIEDWLDALERVGGRERLELCVVDSGSRPEERRLLAERVAPRVDVLLERPNLGYGRCSNEGAAASRAPVLLFTNPDTRVRRLPDSAWEGDLGGRVLGAFKLVAGAPDKPLGFAHPPDARHEAQELLLGRWSRGYARSADAPAWVSGAALLVARSDFERAGGFPPDHFLYFEDADLCARHRARGGRVALDPGFVVEHGSGRSSAVEDPERVASALDAVNRLSARTFAARHGRAWHRPLLYALLALAYVPRQVVARLLGRRGRRAGAMSHALDLLYPARALRRLGVPDARSPRR
jgi:hypothetical protein